jgi:hypothetical protein
MLAASAGPALFSGLAHFCPTFFGYPIDVYFAIKFEENKRFAAVNPCPALPPPVIRPAFPDLLLGSGKSSIRGSHRPELRPI